MTSATVEQATASTSGKTSERWRIGQRSRVIVSAGGGGGGGRRRLPHQHCVASARGLAMRGTSERPAAEVCNDSLIKLAAMRGGKLMLLCFPKPL